MVAVVIGLWMAMIAPGAAQDPTLERLLRAQAFDKVFDGFEFYAVSIIADEFQPDGSREVTAVASGKFLDHVQRMKVLFLIVDEQVIGGQVLEANGLPPCLSQDEKPAASL